MIHLLCRVQSEKHALCFSPIIAYSAAREKTCPTEGQACCIYTSLHHAVEQRLEIIHVLIDHAVTMQFFKQLLRTRYFCLLNRTKLE